MKNQKLSESIRAARIHKKLTQLEVACRMGMEQPTYSKWEKRVEYMPVTMLIKLCSVLDISLAELLESNPVLVAG